MRALIGLTVLVGGALGGIEHMTQQNPALLTPLWTSIQPADKPTDSAVAVATAADPAKPATDGPVVKTLAVAKTPLATLAPSPSAPKTVEPKIAEPKIADVIVPPVKRVKPMTPPAEPVAVATPEVKTAAVAAAGAVAVVAAAKTAKTFAGRSTLGGPVPDAATPPAAVAASKVVAPKSVVKANKQAAAKTTPAASVQKRPGFKLTCTSAQKLDVEKQRCVATKGKLATAVGKPRA